MRVDKFKYKNIDKIWGCPECGAWMKYSVGGIQHMEKCWNREGKHARQG